LDQPIPESAAALIGSSDVDPEENAALSRSKIARLDADAMRNPGGVENRIRNLLAPRANSAAAWYLHVDLDVAGPDEVPGGLTPTASPPQVEALCATVAAVAASLPVRALGLATYNPSADPERKGVAFAAQILRSALASNDGIC
jgi:arginase family enzyme